MAAICSGLQLSGGDYYDQLYAKAAEMARRFPEVYLAAPDHVRRALQPGDSRGATSRRTRDGRAGVHLGPRARGGHRSRSERRRRLRRVGRR